jgi:NAD-dependent dihydropyrimidine dehydrogenase PreA subunit
MAYVIAQPCIGVKDAACVTVCPMDCIHPLKEEAGFASADQLYIQPDQCIDCDMCLEECPVRAIFPEADVPAEWRDFIDKNAAYYRNQQNGLLNPGSEIRNGSSHSSDRSI